MHMDHMEYTCEEVHSTARKRMVALAQHRRCHPGQRPVQPWAAWGWATGTARFGAKIRKPMGLSENKVLPIPMDCHHFSFSMVIWDTPISDKPKSGESQQSRSVWEVKNDNKNPAMSSHQMSIHLFSPWPCLLFTMLGQM